MKFFKKDVFYDNGLVNIILYLDELFELKNIGGNQKINEILDKFSDYEKKEDENYVKIKFNYNNSTIEVVLSSNNLEINGNENNINDFLKDLYTFVLIQTHTIYETKNFEYRYNFDKNKIIKSNKIDVKGKGSGNDIKHPKDSFRKKITNTDSFFDMLKKEYNENSDALLKTISDIGFKIEDKSKLSDKEIKKIEKAREKGTLLELDLDNYYLYNTVGTVLSTFDMTEFTKAYIEYMLDKKEIILDSKVNPFEEAGKGIFEDFLKEKNNKISKENLIIYQIGQKGKKYFGGSYYFYIFNVDLLSLYDVKTSLGIIDYLDANDNTNFEENKVYSVDEEYFQLIKIINFIYEKLNSDNIIEYLKDSFNSSGIMLYKGGDLKEILLFYNKLSIFIRFLKEIDNKKLLDSFYSLLRFIYFVVSKHHGKTNNMPEFKLIGKKITNLILFHKDIASLMEKNLSLDKKNKQSLTSKFYDLYSNYIKMQGNDNTLHSICKNVGEKIGYFLSKSEKNGEEILFKLRNVKNKTQLLDWLSLLYFAILKEPDKQMKETSKDINSLLTQIFDDNFEDIKSYLTIYAIQKYIAVNKANDNSEK